MRKIIVNVKIVYDIIELEFSGSKGDESWIYDSK